MYHNVGANGLPGQHHNQPNAFRQNMSTEQAVAFRRQQQLLYQQQQQQQQQYFLQQQKLQKQMMREEQRNRLRNMNVKTMGIPTYNVPTCSAHNIQSNGPYQYHYGRPNTVTSVSGNNQGYPTFVNNTQTVSAMYNSPTVRPYGFSNRPAISTSTNTATDQVTPNNSSLAGVVTYNSSTIDTNNTTPAIFSNIGVTAYKNQTNGILTDDIFSAIQPVNTAKSQAPDAMKSGYASYSQNFLTSELGQLISDPSTTNSASLSNAVNISSAPANEIPDTDEFGDFNSVVSNDFSTDVVTSNIPTSIAAPITPPSHEHSLLGASYSDNSNIGNTSPIIDLAPEQVDDDFDDFTAAPEVPANQACLKGSADYVPGTLKNENDDVVYSVAAFSNPIKTEAPQTLKSEFDKLIEKSLSGRASKSDPKSLFRAPVKLAIPTVKSAAKESSQAANWCSLDLGDMFTRNEDAAISATFQKDDSFDDFVSSEENRSNALFENAFSDSKPSIKRNNVLSENKDSLIDITSSNPEAEERANIFSKIKSKQNKYDTVPGLLIAGDAVSEDIIEDNWFDFVSTPSENIIPPLKPLHAPTNPKSSDFEVSRLPKLYRDIIDYCNTRSGIIDVSKVYSIMLTPRFKLTDLQPLMSQCNMSSAPTPKDMVDLIALVGMKQKGFPTPSKYEIDFRRPPIPNVNSSLLGKIKPSQTSQSSEDTLLSLVTPTESSKSKNNGLKSVFDFGGENTDFTSKPIISSDSLASITQIGITEDVDDWGDFNEISDVSASFDVNVSMGPQLSAERFTANFEKPVDDKRLIPLNEFSSVKIRHPKPLPIDEPPPMLDDDDKDDWADFTHPSTNWDIDYDVISDTTQDNRSTKIRWGSTSLPSTSERRFIDDASEKTFKNNDKESTQCAEQEGSKFFVQEDHSLDLQRPSHAEEINDLEENVVVNFNKDALTETADSGDNKSESISSGLSRSTQGGKDEIPAPKRLTNMDCLAPLDDDDNLEMMFNNSNNLFVDFVADNVLPAYPKEKELVPNQNDDSFDDSPFANFMASDDTVVQADLEKTLSEDDDFDDFQVGTYENSLNLKSLPSKDLDGFWNDMVDSLAPKLSSEVIETKEETSFAPFADFNQIAPVLEHEVSYDALKNDEPSSEEDRLGAWSKCLSLILTNLIQCQNIFSEAKGNALVIAEVVNSDHGGKYLKCCIEVFKIAYRISQAGFDEDGVVEIFKEIKHVWTFIAELLDEHYDLPNVRDLQITSPMPPRETTSEQNCCGVCLLETSSLPASEKLRYNGVFYHLTCANFWINSVNSILPNLNPKLSVPLL